MDQGLVMDVPDLLLAATALVRGMIVVTHNTQHFTHIPGLQLADWLVP
jgi:predicted nucleic acid-binding protein